MAKNILLKISRLGGEKKNVKLKEIILRANIGRSRVVVKPEQEQMVMPVVDGR